MNRLSERLSRIAEMVSAGNVLADVGCDHGYLPIMLVQSGCVRRAIAMDVNEGPLMRAAEHIAQEALGAYIETRRSDGLEALAPGEADAAVIAGMGGALTIDILSRGEAVVRALEQLILEPQSQLERVRAFLREADYFIEKEELVREDGKYYPILRVLPKQPSDAVAFAETSGLPLSVLDAYGHRLLAARHPVLAAYLEKEYRQCAQILQGLSGGRADAERIALRRRELSEKMEQNRRAAAYMREGG